MARSKKKSGAHRSDDHEDVQSETAGGEAVDVTHEEATTPAGEAAGASVTESDDEDVPKKKKEYHGNKLKRAEERKTKKAKKAGNIAGNVGAKDADTGNDKGRSDAREGDTENDGEGELQVTRQRAVEVLYCPICTFPAEMCEFSGMMEKCRPWLQEHAAELADAVERGRKRRVLTEKDRLEAMIEGRGIKTALERIVLIEVDKRAGKRVITSVFGMDLFGFNLKDLSKDWRKAFACGAGVRSAEEGSHQDCIDIQGNIADQLVSMLVGKYNVPKDAIYIMEDKKKKKYFN